VSRRIECIVASVFMDAAMSLGDFDTVWFRRNWLL
jgi:hypothetical protein